MVFTEAVSVIVQQHAQLHIIRRNTTRHHVQCSSHHNIHVLCKT